MSQKGKKSETIDMLSQKFLFLLVGLAKHLRNCRTADEYKIGLRQDPVKSTYADGKFLPRLSNYKLEVTPQFRQWRREKAKSHFAMLDRARVQVSGTIKEVVLEEAEDLEEGFEEEEAAED